MWWNQSSVAGLMLRDDATTRSNGKATRTSTTSGWTRTSLTKRLSRVHENMIESKRQEKAQTRRQVHIYRHLRRARRNRGIVSPRAPTTTTTTSKRNRTQRRAKERRETRERQQERRREQHDNEQHRASFIRSPQSYHHSIIPSKATDEQRHNSNKTNTYEHDGPSGLRRSTGEHGKVG